MYGKHDTGRKVRSGICSMPLLTFRAIRLSNIDNNTSLFYVASRLSHVYTCRKIDPSSNKSRLNRWCLDYKAKCNPKVYLKKRILLAWPTAVNARCLKYGRGISRVSTRLNLSRTLFKIHIICSISNISVCRATYSLLVVWSHTIKI